MLKLTRRTLLAPLACAAALSLLPGCALTILPGNPRPNIALTPKQSTLALKIGSKVDDNFPVPTQNGIMGGDVQGWHTTLATGFKNGFGDAFKLAEGSADSTLTIDEAGLEFVPAAVSGQYGVVAANAQVRFKATLTQGGAQRRMAGTAVSKKSTMNRGEATSIAMSAVESMFEAIAQDLFAEPKGK